MLKKISVVFIFLFFVLLKPSFCENTLIYKNLIGSPIISTKLTTPFIVINNKLYFYSYGTILTFNGEKINSFFNVSSKLPSNLSEDVEINDKFAYIPIKKQFIIALNYIEYDDNFNPNVKSKIFFINFDGSYQSKDIILDNNSNNIKLYSFFKDDNGTLYLCNEAISDNNCFLIADKEGNTENFGKLFSFNLHSYNNTENTTKMYKESDIIEYDETSQLKIYKLMYDSYIFSPISNYNYSNNNPEIKLFKRFKLPINYSYYAINVFEINNKITVLIIPYVSTEIGSVAMKSGFLIVNEDINNLLTKDQWEENSVFNIDNDTAKYIDFSKTIYGEPTPYFPLYLNEQIFLFGNYPEFYKLENNLLKLLNIIYPFIGDFAYNGSIVAWLGPKSIVYYNKLTENLGAISAPFVNGSSPEIYSILGNKFLILNREYSQIEPENDPNCKASACYQMVIALYDENLKLINKTVLKGYSILNPWGVLKIFPYDKDNKTFCIDYQDMTESHEHHFYCYDDSLNLKYKFDGNFINGIFYKNYFIGNDSGTVKIINLKDNNTKWFNLDNYLRILETDKYAIFAGSTGTPFKNTGYKIFTVKWDKLLSFDPQNENIEDLVSSEYISNNPIGSIYPLIYGNYLYLIGFDFNENVDYTVIQFKINDNGKIEKMNEYNLNNFDDPQNLVIADYDGNAHFLYNKDNNIYEIQLSSTTNQFTLNLSSGWNLVGNPFKSNINIETFSNSKIVSVWKWSNRWEVYSPTENIQKIIKKYNIPQISYISPLNGLWINAKENSTIQINGIFGNIDDVVNSINFTWTLLTTGEDINNTILTEKFNNVKSIWKWSNNKWEIWTPLLKLKELLKKYKIPEIEQIDIGEGFWINK